MVTVDDLIMVSNYVTIKWLFFVGKISDLSKRTNYLWAVT